MPAFPLWAFTRWHHHNNWGSRHPIAAYYSFIDLESMKGCIGCRTGCRGRASPKWSILCPVGRKTLTHWHDRWNMTEMLCLVRAVVCHDDQQSALSVAMQAGSDACVCGWNAAGELRRPPHRVSGTRRTTHRLRLCVESHRLLCYLWFWSSAPPVSVNGRHRRSVNVSWLLIICFWNIQHLPTLVVNISPVYSWNSFIA